VEIISVFLEILIKIQIFSLNIPFQDLTSKLPLEFIPLNILFYQHVDINPVKPWLLHKELDCLLLDLGIDVCEQFAINYKALDFACICDDCHL